MDLLHHVGPGQAEQVVVALQKACVVAEALASEVGLLQLLSLEHGPDRSVEHEDPISKQAAKPGFGAH